MAKIAIIVFANTITKEALGKVSNAFVLAMKPLKMAMNLNLYSKEPEQNGLVKWKRKITYFIQCILN